MAKEITLTVNLDELELDDLEILDRSKPDTTMHEFLNVLDRLVEGGVRGKGYKLTELQMVSGTLLEAVEAQANPEVGEKN